MVLYLGNLKVCRIQCAQPNALSAKVFGLVRKPIRSVAHAAGRYVVVVRPQKDSVNHISVSAANSCHLNLLIFVKVRPYIYGGLGTSWPTY